MKRFTETTKWGDPWFRKLKPEIKLLWQWLLDNCDNAGVIDPDMDLASFQIGYQYPINTLSELGDRVAKLPSGKYLVKKFVLFQYGDRLSSECKAHNPVFQSLKSNSVELSMIGYAKGIGKGIYTPQDHTIPVKETDHTISSKVYSPESRVALHYLNEKSGRSFRERESSLSVIQARLDEDGVDIDGVKKMIDRQCARWKGTPQEEYLRPETLFGKTKFDGYYAAKDLPIKDGKTIANHEGGF